MNGISILASGCHGIGHIQKRVNKSAACIIESVLKILEYVLQVYSRITYEEGDNNKIKARNYS